MDCVSRCRCTGHGHTHTDFHPGTHSCSCPGGDTAIHSYRLANASADHGSHAYGDGSGDSVGDSVGANRGTRDRHSDTCRADGRAGCNCYQRAYTTDTDTDAVGRADRTDRYATT